jgi:hypothetical protein
MQVIDGFISPAAHPAGIGIAPFEFVDIQKVQVRKSRNEQFEAGQGGDLDPDGIPHLFCMFCRPDEVRVENGIPAFTGWVEPDLIDEPVHPGKLAIGRGFSRIEMNMVIRAEMIPEQPAVPGYLIETEERFSAGDTGTKGTHIFGFLDDLGRDIDRVFICINGIGPFPLTGQRAIPAGAVASPRNKEHHLCSLMTENTSL